MLQHFLRRLALAAGVIGLVTAAALWPSGAAEPLSAQQIEQFENLVRDYLLKNPEVLIEAMRSLEQRQAREAEALARQAIAVNRKALDRDPGSFVGGNPQGDVTVVEFFDYRCGYCKQMHAALQDIVKKDGKIRLVYKEFPVLGPDSLLASRYAVAALNQGAKYAAYHDALMSSRGAFNDEILLQYAREVGLDLVKLKADLQHPRVDQVLRANRQLGEVLGVRGTPAFVIGDELVPGAQPASRMVELIAQARAGCTTC